MYIYILYNTCPQDVGLPVGSYVYGIADYGNIIAIAPNADHVEKIW